MIARPIGRSRAVVPTVTRGRRAAILARADAAHAVAPECQGRRSGPVAHGSIPMGVDTVAWGYAALIMVVSFIVVGVLANRVSRRRGPQGPAEPWHRWQPGDRRPKRPTAHDLLRERRARGELNVEDYDELLAALGPDPYAEEASGSAPGEHRKRRHRHRT